jgi:hypothetical protein
MAVQNGIIQGNMWYNEHDGNRVPAGSKITQGDPYGGIPLSDYGMALRVGQGMTDISQVQNGIVVSNYGDLVLFWRIWFEPVLIDAGFIVEDKNYNVKVWNAYLDQTISITDIAGATTDGTEIFHDPVPIDIGKFGDEWMTITVYGEGPPLQSTVYTFTIEAVEYETDIEGIRVTPIAWEPNWNNKVNIEMHFDTVMERNRYFVEQRRPLRYKPYYKFTFSLQAEGVDAQKLKQSLAYGHDKVFGVPVYTEQLHPSADFNSSSTIQTSNDLTDFWNLNNLAEYVVIIDHTTLLAEIKELASVSANQIVCSIPVTNTFTWQRSVVYPVVMCTGDSFTMRPESDDVWTSDLSFVEYERASAT